MQKSTKNTAPTLSLLFSFEEEKRRYDWDRGRLRFSLAPITLEDGRPGNISSWDKDLGGLMLGDLRITTWGDDGDGLVTDAMPPDGRSRRALSFFETDYRGVYSVDIRCAERMLRTLRTIERKMARVVEVEGPTHLFPVYVRRVARILGIKHVTWKVGNSGSHTYNALDYRTVPLEGGLMHIERLELDWRLGKEVSHSLGLA